MRLLSGVSASLLCVLAMGCRHADRSSSEVAGALPPEVVDAGRGVSGFGRPCEWTKIAELKEIPAGRSVEEDLLRSVWKGEPKTTGEILAHVDRLDSSTLGASVMAASVVGNEASLMHILEAGHVPDADQLGIGLITAAQCGEAGVARILLNNGADPNYTKGGLDAMISAIIAKSPDTAEAIIDHGYAGCRLKTPNGKTARVYATDAGLDWIAQKLPVCP